MIASINQLYVFVDLRVEIKIHIIAHQDIAIMSRQLRLSASSYAIIVSVVVYSSRHLIDTILSPPNNENTRQWRIGNVRAYQCKVLLTRYFCTAAHTVTSEELFVLFDDV